MSICKIVKNCQKEFTIYDSCHQQHLNNQWQVFREELIEFRENPIRMKS